MRGDGLEQNIIEEKLPDPDREALIVRLQTEPTEQHLWDAVVACQKLPFWTYSGLPFTYELHRGRDGSYTKELWIDRRENSKSLAWSSVLPGICRCEKRENHGEASERAGRYPWNFIYLRIIFAFWAD